MILKMKHFSFEFRNTRGKEGDFDIFGDSVYFRHLKSQGFENLLNNNDSTMILLSVKGCYTEKFVPLIKSSLELKIIWAHLAP